MPRGKIGVGFLGAGPVTQAIHLPTLARLTETFAVVHVNDIDATVAASVAGRVGAAHSTRIDALLDDPRVEVVAICSPHRFHAAQVIAACRAGKKAVLCEKPFAMSGEEATEIAAVSAETGVPIIVGAMHTFDPAWKAAVANWGDLPATSHTIRSSIVLPPNPRFEDFATEVITRPTFPSRDLDDVEVRAAMVHGGVMGLAIHDLPLVRALLPRFDDVKVLRAHVIAPLGLPDRVDRRGEADRVARGDDGDLASGLGSRGVQQRTGAAHRVPAVLRPRRLRCDHDPHRPPGVGVRTGKPQRL